MSVLKEAARRLVERELCEQRRDVPCSKEKNNTNRYKELFHRQQKEIEALPLGWAFGQKQFAAMMRGWGLDPEKDVDKIYSIGSGGYIHKKDVELLRQTLAKHEEELSAAIAEDKTGTGFIYEMFLYELDNHEYGYTGDTSDALDALGLTPDEVMADKRLKKGIELAHKKIMGRN